MIILIYVYLPVRAFAIGQSLSVTTQTEKGPSDAEYGRCIYVSDEWYLVGLDWYLF
jgi:hypothetical protein